MKLLMMNHTDASVLLTMVFQHFMENIANLMLMNANATLARMEDARISKAVISANAIAVGLVLTVISKSTTVVNIPVSTVVLVFQRLLVKKNVNVPLDGLDPTVKLTSMIVQKMNVKMDHDVLTK